MSVMRTVKSANKALLRNPSASVLAAVELGKIAREVRKLIPKTSDANTVGFDTNGWVRTKPKTRVKATSMKVKRKAKSKRALVKTIKATIAGEIPHARAFTLTAALGKIIYNQQTIINVDTNTNFLSLNMAGDIQDIAAIAFNGKSGVYNGRFVTTNNLSIAEPIQVRSASSEMRIVNNNPFAVEMDFYEFDVVQTSNIDPLTLWTQAYKNVNYIYNGTNPYTPFYASDFYSNPNEGELFKTFFKTKKVAYSLMPGQEKKIYVKGRTGSFLPEKFATATSTVAAPNINQSAAGWTKYFLIVVRGQMATTYATALGTNPIHASSQTTPTASGVACEFKTTYKFQMPEGTPVALRQEVVLHQNFFPTFTPGGAGLVNPISNVNNPVQILTT